MGRVGFQHLFILEQLYESPGGNQVDGLPPAPHSGGGAIPPGIGSRLYGAGRGSFLSQFKVTRREGKAPWVLLFSKSNDS